MKAADWIDAVLSHKTDDYIYNQEMVNALCKIVTLTSREEAAVILESFAKLNGDK